jgi:hypothetical protein
VKAFPGHKGAVREGCGRSTGKGLGSGTKAGSGRDKGEAYTRVESDHIKQADRAVAHASVQALVDWVTTHRSQWTRASRQRPTHTNPQGEERPDTAAVACDADLLDDKLLCFRLLILNNHALHRLALAFCALQRWGGGVSTEEGLPWQNGNSTEQSDRCTHPFRHRPVFPLCCWRAD